MTADEPYWTILPSKKELKELQVSEEIPDSYEVLINNTFQRSVI